MASISLENEKKKKYKKVRSKEQITINKIRKTRFLISIYILIFPLTHFYVHLHNAHLFKPNIATSNYITGVHNISSTIATILLSWSKAYSNLFGTKLVPQGKKFLLAKVLLSVLWTPGKSTLILLTTFWSNIRA